MVFARDLKRIDFPLNVGITNLMNNDVMQLNIETLIP
jgi:hypothetical protein